MWARKECACCKTDFGVHPKANTYTTRQLCGLCRKALMTSMPTKYLKLFNTKET